MKYVLSLFAMIVCFLGQAQGYDVGEFATDFELNSVKGNTVSLSDFDDAKGFIVVFTCNTCPYAKLYEDRLISLDMKFAEKGYPVIAINPNDPNKSPGDSFDAMKERAKEKNFTFPYLFDETQKVAKAYGATRTPHVFVLRKEGNRYRVMYIGAIDDNYRSAEDVEETYVENAVEALLKGASVPRETSKAIGCTIKWSS